MAMPQNNPGRVPVFESVREGFAFIARDWRGIVPLALIGAAALAPLQVWQQTAAARQDMGGVIGASMLAALVNVPLLAAYFRRAASRGEAPLALRAGADEANLAGATASVAFLGFIVATVGALLVGMALAALLMRSGADASSLENLAPQEAAAALSKALGADGLLVFFTLVTAFAAFLLWLTARLVLAYPATVVEKRMLIFSTWGWTKGHAMAIAACLILVMVAALVLTWIAGQPIGMLIELALGKGTLATAGTPANWLFSFASGFLGNMFYLPAYAATAAYLYRGLRPSA
ncbi:MAG: hypothetical protein IV086_18860 [Hyphomonadaceae bacterium]|nr:MAG: hypothetical protein FD160_1681 [Caulobacteraceae bacterium]MBT9447759.1 hypothetical protein [Hyphomonadaceae bacterium]